MQVVARRDGMCEWRGRVERGEGREQHMRGSSGEAAPLPLLPAIYKGTTGEQGNWCLSRGEGGWEIRNWCMKDTPACVCFRERD